jgi:hypothetical protein
MHNLVASEVDSEPSGLSLGTLGLKPEPPPPHPIAAMMTTAKNAADGFFM